MGNVYVKMPVGSYLLYWNTGAKTSEIATQFFSDWRSAFEMAKILTGPIKLFQFQAQNPSPGGTCFWHLIYEGKFKRELSKICFEAELDYLFYFLKKPIEINIYFRQNKSMAHGSDESRLLKALQSIKLPDSSKYYSSVKTKKYYSEKMAELQILLLQKQRLGRDYAI